MKKVLTVIGAALAGLAAGVLAAPKSGKETRQDIKNKVDEFKNVADKKASQTKDAAKDSAKSIRTGAQRVGEVASETAHEARENVGKHFK